MKTGCLDLLVIGEPEETLAPKNSVDIERFPFTFEGLGNAYRRLPRTHVVVLIPNEDIFASMPKAKHFDVFLPEKGGGGLNPIFAKLGLLYPVQTQDEKTIPKQMKPAPTLLLYKKSVPKQAKIALDSFQKSDPTRFIKRAAHAFLLEILKRIATLVNGGGEAYLLLPSEWNESNNDLKKLFFDVFPGIQMGHSTLWTMQVGGEWDWIMKAVESDLDFDLTQDHYQERIEAPFVGVPAVIPNPHRILEFLEPEVELHYSASVADTSGKRRTLVFNWGEGSFILAPNACMPVIIKHLNEKKAATASSQATPQSTFVSTPSPDAVPATKLTPKKRKSWPKIDLDTQEKVLIIWEKYSSIRVRTCNQPEYNHCYKRHESALKELGVVSGRHLKAVLDAIRKNNANQKKRKAIEKSNA